MTQKEAYYILVEGRFYKGDIEGKQYHWKKGIPGSTQIVHDLNAAFKVQFIYYRTWNKEIKNGKYFYGYGCFDNKNLECIKSSNSSIEYLAGILHYDRFISPVFIENSLRKTIWPGANRQAGIKRVSADVFNMIKERGISGGHISGAALLVGEQNLENLLNEQISPMEFKDGEVSKAVRRIIKTEIFKRTQRIIRKLKKRYKGLCQISGERIASSRIFDVDVTEAHHIQYLSKDGADDDPSNIIVLSPEWHRLIHKEDPIFDRINFEFIFKNGYKLKVKHPGHLAYFNEKNKETD